MTDAFTFVTIRPGNNISTALQKRREARTGDVDFPNVVEIKNLRTVVKRSCTESNASELIYPWKQKS